MNQSTRTGKRKTALITGASSGIGYELAKLFAHDGFNLVLVARNREALTQLAALLEGHYGISARSIAKDLSIPSSSDEIYEELQKESVSVDALVNCAGFGTSGFFSETDYASELNMIQVNMIALTRLTKLFLRDKLKRREGRVLNVASSAAFQPGPLMAVYYASKAYVLSFSEAIAEEVRGSGVTVTALCPGPVRTGFEEKAGAAQSRLFKGGGVLDAETVAKTGYEGLMHNKTVVIPGLRTKILAFGVRLTPRNWVTRIARRLNERA